jgi:exodeoxyribonuclease VII large subunit
VDGQISLTELNFLIKESLDVSFPEQLWVIAEIGELKVNRAGHCYIELVEKDNNTDKIKARSRATIWTWQFRFIQPYFETTTGQKLQAGLKVLVAVSVEFHEVYGISLNIKDIDPNYTLGDMARKRQEIINSLTEEGVFDMNKEIPLAEIPSRIAIISSPTAAGYEDFMSQLINNTEGYKFYTKLFPASMQGKEASSTIINALDYIYEYEDLFDLVVIIRGGGSQMDLSCFDDYDLALHVTQFPLPVVTGIGHEKDESIVDLVANTKLKTPTAVAEFLISQFNAIAIEIAEIESQFIDEINRSLENEENRIKNVLQVFKPLIKGKLENTDLQLKHLAKTIQPVSNELIERNNYILLKYTDHLEIGLPILLKEKNNELTKLMNQTLHVSTLKTTKEQQLVEEKCHQLIRFTHRKIDTEVNRLGWLEKTNILIDPKNILKRGFSISTRNGKVIKNANELKNNDEIETTFYKGKVNSTVKKH